MIKRPSFPIAQLSLLPLLVLMLLPAICSAQVASGGAFSLEKTVIAGGGGASENGSFSVSGTNAQNASGTVASNFPIIHFPGFWAPDVFMPTAAIVSIGGRVASADGRGIRNAQITLTDVNGGVKTIMTGAFGYFRFTEITVGETYVLTVSSKRFVFKNPSLVINVQESRDDYNFEAEIFGINKSNGV